ncbi:hypothetical protein NLI96_g4208 [Meripilus lineatus]|uniref:Uncharacterized protein n=1 Tax=Meripilus lineatus TaxID=2056292 RepID=A0AAD5VAC0_9APHY|nr:hypothetical protein NLI96_g4208 [Physisporinus lineatus]
MAAVLPPRQGILLNPSPSCSPFQNNISLPGTPHLIPSCSSLSSTASSSNGASDADPYFLTTSNPKPRSRRPSSSHHHPRNPSPITRRPATSDGTKANAGSYTSNARRIRFAPMPDPRREVLVTEDGNEIPFPDEVDDNVITVREYSPRPSLDRPISSSTGGKTLNSSPSLLLASNQHGISLVRPHDTPAPDSTHSSSSNSDSTPTPSTTVIESTTSPSCGAPTSANGQSAPPVPGVASDRTSLDTTTPLSPKSSPHLASHTPELSKLPLESSKASRRKSGKWTSKLFGPLLGHKGGDEADMRRTESLRDFGSGRTGVPFDRTSTITSTLTTNSLPPTLSSPPLRPRKKGKSHSLFSSPTATSLHIFGSSKNSKKAEVSRSQSVGSKPGGVRRGQLRMLNGRVYGARRVDPFANIKDEEPEFIEWGFGGMGSVSNGGGSVWSKLQSNAGVSVGACDEPSWGGSTGSGTSSGGSGRGADDFDDGSGMAWVRRRKEKREQERKEREEQERKEREAAAEKENVDVEQSADEEASKVGDVADVKDVKEREEHITQAVTVPAPSHHHIHHHTHRPTNSFDRASTIRAASERRTSVDTARGAPSVIGSIKDGAVSLAVAHDKNISNDSGDADVEDLTTSPDASANPSEDDLSSASSSESESDEDEQLEREQAQLLAKGAGVEKISRHKLTPSQSYVHSPDGTKPAHTG